MNVEFVDLKPPHEIKTLVRGIGMDYEFQEPLQPWSWRKMLKAIKPELRDQIFGRFGEDLPVGALVERTYRMAENLRLVVNNPS